MSHIKRKLDEIRQEINEQEKVRLGAALEELRDKLAAEDEETMDEDAQRLIHGDPDSPNEFEGLDSLIDPCPDKESEKRLYAVACVARKEFTGYSNVQAKPIACAAVSDDEAVGIGIRVAKEQWPTDEGWYDHQAMVVVVPDDTVQLAYPNISPGKELQE